jgi:predicted NBD/HSP70 family sugar kinase
MLESGIGAAVVINGKLYRGAHWGAGEIAHSILDPRHATTDWGGRGFLESMVGADRLAERLGCSVEEVPRFFTGEHRLNGPGQEVIEETVNFLGLAIIEVVAAYDPSLVVLQGPLFAPTLGRIRQLVRRAIPWTTTSITLSALDAEAVLMGTVVAARSRAFERIALNLNEVAEASPAR